MAKKETSQLNSLALLQKVKSRAQSYVQHGQIPEAARLANQLEAQIKASPKLALSDPEMHRQYLRIVLWLKLSSFSLYDHETCLGLIKNHYLDSLKLHVDMNEVMNAKMYSIPDLAWPDFAENCVKALKSNKQAIGQKSLKIEGMTSAQPPLIKNWLVDYDRTHNIEKHTELERSQYLAQSSNTQNLTGQEREWLMQLLRFYDNLKPIPASVFEKKLPPTRAPVPVATTPASKAVQDDLESSQVKSAALTPSKPATPISQQPETNGNIVDLKKYLDKS